MSRYNDASEPLERVTEFEGLRAKAENLESQWLSNRGWKFTSQTPGCYWMYLKEWDGKTFLVDRSTASRIQRTWDGMENERLHPEQYED